MTNPSSGGARARSDARTARRGRTIIVAIAAAATTAAAMALANPATAASDPGAVSARAAAQIAALQALKGGSGPVAKLDSRLAVAARTASDTTAASSLAKAAPKLKVPRAADHVSVDISVTAVSDDLTGAIEAAGGTVAYASTRLRTIRATLPVSGLTTIAARKDVTAIRTADEYLTAAMTPPGTSPAGGGAASPASAESKQQEAARLDRIAASVAAATRKVTPRTGSVVSEGDRAHAADTARSRFRVSGVGVKVCALSDGVDSLAASQASGDLPDVDVLPGQAGAGDEGTAMLEIIHDLAPKAELGFATADISAASFADNILALRTQAHCDIIVDDVVYFSESPFQDGPIAQAVESVTHDGALYFSSAGNEGNLLSGSSGNYEADFRGSGQSIAKFRGEAHDFDPGAGTQVFDPLADMSAGVPAILQWNDPLGRSGNDYDLYDLDSAGNVLAFSQDVQDGNDDPFEGFYTDAFASGQRLAVVKYSGATRYFQLTAFRGQFWPSDDGLRAYATGGVTRGHSTVVDAFSVAAAPAADPLPFAFYPGDSPNPSGPYPGVFTKKQVPEIFTSDGPRRMFYKPDGTPYTPGNLTATGGVVRQKPDITAADGVMTSVDGYDPFFGTSAAAPHAAAIAALVLSGNPGAGESLVREAFDRTALDLAPKGVDDRTGHGVILATRVLANTGATPQPLVTAGTPTVTPTTGDGDAYLEPGESASVSLPVTNVGDARATGVSVRMTATDAKATVTPASRSYGAVPVGATAARTFTLKLGPRYPVGQPVHLTVRTQFAGALSPTTKELTVRTGQPATTATTFAYTGPAVPIPDDTPAGVSIPLRVTGMTYAAKVTFSVDGTTCTTNRGATKVGIDHTFVGDLVGTLTSPSGRTATLFSRDGSSGHNLCRVVFDDAAASPFASATSADAPFTGSWQPTTPLEPLLADPVSGTWHLTVSDNAFLDTGSVRAFSLHVTGFQH